MLNCRVRCIESGSSVVKEGNFYEFKNGFFIKENGHDNRFYRSLEDFYISNKRIKFELITENYTTLEMMNLAEENGKTYISGQLAYSKKDGFQSYDFKTKWTGKAFSYLNDLLELNDWQEVETHKEMTIEEIQKELGYKVKIVE